MACRHKAARGYLPRPGTASSDEAEGTGAVLEDFLEEGEEADGSATACQALASEVPAATV